MYGINFITFTYGYYLTVYVSSVILIVKVELWNWNCDIL